MKKTILIAFILLSNLCLAQSEKPEYKKVADQFVINYNSENYEAVFSMFATVMKEALPLEKTTEFLKGLKSQAGKIKDRAFITYENRTYASYKTTFEAAVLILNLSIDTEGKINGLFVRPFVEEVDTSDIVNKLTAKEGVITKKQVDLVFDKAKVFPSGSQLSIGIIKDGNVQFYGVKNTKGTFVEVENYKNVFEIGSISKVFTSNLLANLVIDNKVKLDDPIHKYLKTKFKDNIELTFVSLANHTSGLSRLPSNLDLTTVDTTNPYKAYTDSELEAYLATELKLSKQKKYQYSNLGMGLLGYTASKIEKTSYENLLQEKIFKKLEMKSSTSVLTKVTGDIIKGRDSEGSEVSNWEFSSLAGAGAIFSTVEDMSKFALAQFDDSQKAFQLARAKTVEVNKDLDMGLGWHILKSQSKNVWHFHNGATGGYTSALVVDTQTKNGIIILSNVSAFNPQMTNIDQLCFELMKTLEQ